MISSPGSPEATVFASRRSRFPRAGPPRGERVVLLDEVAADLALRRDDEPRVEQDRDAVMHGRGRERGRLRGARDRHPPVHEEGEDAETRRVRERLELLRGDGHAFGAHDGRRVLGHRLSLIRSYRNVLIASTYLNSPVSFSNSIASNGEGGEIL